MTIAAKVVADSIQTFHVGNAVVTKNRLTTFVLKYPRFVHAEFMTHRVFSRNAASSRAIPIKTMIQRIIDDPAMPVHWGKNQPGMQANEELPDECNRGPYGPFYPSTRQQAKNEWLAARDEAIKHVNKLMDIGLHKQISNRILEPWMHIEVVCTGTDFANFYALRNHPMAQPEMQALAKAMLKAHEESTPAMLQPGEWHLPFIRPEDTRSNLTHDELPLYFWHLAQISAARCARVSYLKHDGSTATQEEDLELYARLMAGNPKHASPAEHQAMVPTESGYPTSNLRGWVQFRKMHDGETIKDYESPNTGKRIP